MLHSRSLRRVIGLSLPGARIGCQHQRPQSCGTFKRRLLTWWMLGLFSPNGHGNVAHTHAAMDCYRSIPRKRSFAGFACLVAGWPTHRRLIGGCLLDLTKERVVTRAPREDPSC